MIIIEKIHALRRLLVVWLIGATLLGGLTVAQTIFGKFGHDPLDVARAWGTFFPWLIPGLVVIVGLMRLRSGEVTSKFMSSFSIWASIAYILMLIGTWAGQSLSERPYHEWVLMSYIWVLPFQSSTCSSSG